MITRLDYGLFRYTGAIVIRNEPGLILTAKEKIMSPDHDIRLYGIAIVRHHVT